MFDLPYRMDTAHELTRIRMSEPLRLHRPVIDSHVVDQTGPEAGGCERTGVMIRSALEPDCPNVMLLTTASGRLSFQYRHRDAEPTSAIYTPPNTIQLPHRVRLVRQDYRFTAQHSNDGVTWQDVLDSSDRPTIIEIPMDEMVYIGLAATSHDIKKTAGARISHVTATGNVSPAGPFTESRDIPSQLPASSQ
jgi:hypothetical protein